MVKLSYSAQKLQFDDNDRHEDSTTMNLTLSICIRNKVPHKILPIHLLFHYFFH